MSRVDKPSEEDKFFSERGFGLRLGFGTRPALLVIDMINGFTDPSMPLGSNLDPQVEAIQLLLKAARTRAVPIVFSTAVYEDPQLRDAGLWRFKQAGLATLRAGTDSVKIDRRLRVEEADTVLVKHYASCFFGTDLVSRLLDYGVDTLIVMGCTTSGCVRASAVDAVQTGFRPMIVQEAVGDRSTRAHEQSLFDLHAKYADVVSLEETVKYLHAAGTT